MPSVFSIVVWHTQWFLYSGLTHPLVSLWWSDAPIGFPLVVWCAHWFPFSWLTHLLFSSVMVWRIRWFLYKGPTHPVVPLLWSDSGHTICWLQHYRSDSEGCMSAQQKCCYETVRVSMFFTDFFHLFNWVYAMLLVCVNLMLGTLFFSWV